MQREESLNGWMFINHLSMQIIYRLYFILKNTPLNKKQNLNHKYSINDAIEHLKSIKKIQFSNQDSVIAEINKKLPSLLTGNFSEAKLLELLQNDANFSIMMGTLILRWNLERFSTFVTGSQLNKAMIAYNAGAYNKAISNSSKVIRGAAVDSTSLAQNKGVPAESRAYLYKMLGIDGFLNLIYKDKVI
jgi:hypothetical protein